MMQTTVEGYLTEGCGRCPLGGTPGCKVHAWSAELHALRGILSKSGLIETAKWGVPCYTLNGKNVLLLSAFKNHCAISFFKGALLKDDAGLLSTPGPNSQASRLLKFTSPDAVEALREATHDFIQQAIAIENAGLQIELNKSPEPWPEELQEWLEQDPVLKDAFEALTPGRQRGYVLYFSAPKQSKTRISRIEKCVDKIMNGEGLHDAYQKKGKA
ncbi:MAG: YdeI/OmpD-associated family protein [Phaeodactylibacter xiamenensis]|nr:YdeI/OmpD-associated family protein [Phaeodactylibacter xiamenensis]